MKPRHSIPLGGLVTISAVEHAKLERAAKAAARAEYLLAHGHDEEAQVLLTGLHLGSEVTEHADGSYFLVSCFLFGFLLGAICAVFFG